MTVINANNLILGLYLLCETCASNYKYGETRTFFPPTYCLFLLRGAPFFQRLRQSPSPVCVKYPTGT